MIRSHEVKQEGSEMLHDNKCLTLFSAPNYMDTVGNKGAVAVLTSPALLPTIVTFGVSPHPNVAPMTYAKEINSFMF